MPSATSPRRPPDEAGTLVVVGGAEDKLGRSTVLARFVAEAGGGDARVVVCATASALGPAVESLYDSVLRTLGVNEVVAVSPRSRAEADDPAAARRLKEASAIFLTGGNQLTLAQTVVGTRFGEAIVDAFRNGCVVGGTSAGASVMSEHMVAFGSGGATPKNRIAQLARGLGLWPEAIVDQHFDQRNRYGRLLSLVAQNPSLLGVGVDEDTGAVVRAGRSLDVVGRGSVFLVDGTAATTNASTASRTQPLLVSGAVVHVLPAGQRFDLGRRHLVEPAAAVHPGEVVDLVATRQEARRVARRPRSTGGRP